MKDKLKSMGGFIAELAVGSAAMGMVGSSMTGRLSGIGQATNSMIGVGLLKSAKDKFW